VEAGWEEGRRHAVDCDLKAFFDTVNHDRLMVQLRGKIRDRQVLALIRRYLQAGVILPDGTPRGYPSRECHRVDRYPRCSPTSYSIHWIRNSSRRGHKFARYADDFIVMVKRARERPSGSKRASFVLRRRNSN
jgi:RNA-directed DNA polymerase